MGSHGATMNPISCVDLEGNCYWQRIDTAFIQCRARHGRRAKSAPTRGGKTHTCWSGSALQRGADITHFRTECVNLQVYQVRSQDKWIHTPNDCFNTWTKSNLIFWLLHLALGSINDLRNGVAIENEHVQSDNTTINSAGARIHVTFHLFWAIQFVDHNCMCHPVLGYKPWQHYPSPQSVLVSLHWEPSWHVILATSRCCCPLF